MIQGTIINGLINGVGDSFPKVLISEPRFDPAQGICSVLIDEARRIGLHGNKRQTPGWMEN